MLAVCWNPISDCLPQRTRRRRVSNLFFVRAGESSRRLGYVGAVVRSPVKCSAVERTEDGLRWHVPGSPPTSPSHSPLHFHCASPSSFAHAPPHPHPAPSPLPSSSFPPLPRRTCAASWSSRPTSAWSAWPRGARRMPPVRSACASSRSPTHQDSVTGITVSTLGAQFHHM